nr:dihydrofolate reductase family protein [Microbacterium testaceum]
MGGVRLPAALANLELIDEFAFVVHPVVSGRGPRLLDGVREQVSLELVERWDFGSGVVMQRYRRPV